MELIIPRVRFQMEEVAPEVVVSMEERVVPVEEEEVLHTTTAIKVIRLSTAAAVNRNRRLLRRLRPPPSRPANVKCFARWIGLYPSSMYIFLILFNMSMWLFSVVVAIIVTTMIDLLVHLYLYESQLSDQMLLSVDRLRPEK
ncbi:hypothetical protein BRADI_1g17116v3 [Brachypodium distachyon]|uniref:Uncharacterized protein n=1 Tax=Brachypodium distachyon TaxID=15368 RepID=A0A0Q3JR69_BRADI|nr:hypothetical protein BRADI_1g17116v3 [Brachypodium distachyon]